MEYITNYNNNNNNNNTKQTQTEIDYVELINSLSIEIETFLHDKELGTDFYLNAGGWVEIDEIPIEIVISTCHPNRKYYYNINALNIKYPDKDEDDTDELVLRVSGKFDNVKELLQELENIIRTYTIIDCLLVSPNYKKTLFLQRSFLFYVSSKKLHCCVCKNPTIEYTTCKHSICLHCRYKCLSDDNKVCPVCSVGDLKIYPSQLRRSIIDYCFEYSFD